MSTAAIQQYEGAKREQYLCKEWASKLGATYYGGTSDKGAKGHLTYFTIAQGEMRSPTIYHQYTDGAKNYHACPPALIPHLEAAIKSRFTEILADALIRQEEAVKASAAEAVKEHLALMEAAGLVATANTATGEPTP